MAQIKSQIKRNITSEKARQRNASFRSAMRTQSKKVRLAVEAKNVEAAQKELAKAYSLFDKGVTKGVLHHNSAARKKAELQNIVNSLSVE